MWTTKWSFLGTAVCVPFSFYSLVTSQGPGTVAEFALQLVESLCGKATRASVAKGMIYNSCVWGKQTRMDTRPSLPQIPTARSKSRTIPTLNTSFITRWITVRDTPSARSTSMHFIAFSSTTEAIFGWRLEYSRFPSTTRVYSPFRTSFSPSTLPIVVCSIDSWAFVSSLQMHTRRSSSKYPFNSFIVDTMRWGDSYRMDAYLLPEISSSLQQRWSELLHFTASFPTTTDKPVKTERSGVKSTANQSTNRCVRSGNRRHAELALHTRLHYKRPRIR